MRGIIFVMALILLLVAGQVQAQPKVSITRPDVEVDFRYEHWDESRDGPVIDQDTTENRFTTSVEVSTEGWIYHPGLLEFELETEPEYRTETVDATNIENRTYDRFFFNYALNATLLQFKPYTVDIFSTKSRDEFNNPLTEDTTVVSGVQRATLRLNYSPFLGSVAFEHRSTDTRGFTNSFIGGNYLRGTFAHAHPRSVTNVFGELGVEDRRSVVFEDTLHRIRFNASNDFTISDKAALYSDLYYRHDDPQQDILTETRIARIIERLSVRHRENLRSDYRFSWDNRETDSRNVDIFEGEAAFNHQLYENLRTVGSFLGNYQTGDDGKFLLLEPSLDMDYVRPFSWGQIRALAGIGYRYDDVDIETDLVTNEPVTLVGVEDVELRGLDIIPGSVFVTDVTETIIYIEGFDYVLTRVGGVTLIRRTGPTSRIASGETVLVDYRFEPVAPFTTGTLDWHAGLGIDLWRLLSLSYTYTRAKEELLAGTAPPDMLDDTIHFFDAELRWRWSTTRFEWEDRDTVRNPTRTLRAAQRLQFQLSRRWSTSAEAMYMQRELRDIDDLQETVRLFGNVRWRIAPRTLWEVEALAQSVDGDRIDTDEIGARTRLRWQYGLWLAQVEYEYVKYEDNIIDQTRDNQRVFLQIVRRFW